MSWLTSVRTIWAAVGALGGVLIGQYLSMRWQRKLWLLDRRKEEFRELLSTLTRSFTTICTKRQYMLPQSPEDQMALQDAEASALMTIRDRIFIAADIKRLDVYNLWISAVNEYNRDHVYIPFSEKYALINAKIVDAAVEATKPLHVKLWEWPRKRWEWFRKRIS